MIKLQEMPNNVVAADVSGKLTGDDYKGLGAAAEKAIQEHGKLNVLVMVHDVKGFAPGALIEELRFDIKYRKDFKRLAVVGQTNRQKWGTKLTAPLLAGEVKYFDESEADKARDWINAPAHEV